MKRLMINSLVVLFLVVTANSYAGGKGGMRGPGSGGQNSSEARGMKQGGGMGEMQRMRMREHAENQKQNQGDMQSKEKRREMMQKRMQQKSGEPVAE